VFDEDTPFVVPPGKAARAALDQRIRDAAQHGVRSVVLCNSMIYGLGAGMQSHSVQVPRLVDEARRRGVVHVVGSGLNRWSNVHIDDVVALYLLALRGAPAGAFYFVENGEASYLEIGQAIAQRLGLGPVQPWSLAQAGDIFGEAAARFTFGSNSRVRALRARRELQWAPVHASLTDWIEREMPLR
jgi:nucleoside-diphosphate-sugar epimerase